MTIKELHGQLNHYMKERSEIADWEVKVVLDQQGIGGVPCIGIRYAYPGFDWDTGKFLMTPTSPVVLKIKPKKLEKD